MVTRPDTAFALNVVSQLLSTQRSSHWNAIVGYFNNWRMLWARGYCTQDCGHSHIPRIFDAKWAGSPIDERSTM